MASTMLALLGAFQAFVPRTLASPSSLQPESQANDGDSSDRDAPFQILADGTQDLAALVGLFATDSVERYAFDYTKGFLAPAVAPLSLLGLLGYVRALLKLSLGKEGCEKAGFSIEALKSMMGVSKSDSSKAQQAVPVFYLKREVKDDMVYWTEVKCVLHDEDSMPIIKACRYLLQEIVDAGEYSLRACFVPSTGQLPTIKSCVSLTLLAFSAFLSGFVVLLFDADPSWTRTYATAGLVISVVLGAAPWSIVHAVECIPVGMSTFFRRTWITRADQGLLEILCRSSTIERDDQYVSIFGLDSNYFVLRCRPITSSALFLVRAISVCAASSIGVAYVCQYISLRTTTAEASGIWLAVQAALAAVRVLMWIWAPTQIPKLESRLLPIHKTLSRMVSFRDIGGQTNLTITRHTTDDFRISYYESFTELEYFICIFTQRFKVRDSLEEQFIAETQFRHRPEDIASHIPCWLADRMSSIRCKSAFRTHIRLRDGIATTEEIENLKSAAKYFDMPCSAFTKWLELKGKWLECYSGFLDDQKRQQSRAFFTCRIIVDRNDCLHLLPGVRRVRPDNDLGRSTSEHIVDYLTCYDSPERNLIVFPTFEPLFGKQLLFNNFMSTGDPKFAGMYKPVAIENLMWVAARAFSPGHGFYDTEIKGMFENMSSIINRLYEQ